MDGTKYGEFLQSRLTARNTNPNQLQSKAGITSAQIGNILKGKSQKSKDGIARPRRDTVIKIAKALGDPIDDHLLAAGFLVPSILETTDPYIQKISTFLNDLPDSYKEDVVALTETIWRRHGPGVVDLRNKGKNSGMSESELRDYFTKEDGIEEETNNSAFGESLSGTDKNKPTNSKGRK